MKIAILAPPWIPIPPVGYGGTERVVYNIVEGMVKKGHDVTLFATGDTNTHSSLKFYYKKALGNDANLKLNPYYALNQIYYFFDMVRKNNFDIVHNNAGRMPLFFADFLKVPFVTTLHGTLFTKDMNLTKSAMDSYPEVFAQFKQYSYISISDKQREGCPDLNYISTIYNGIILEEFDFNAQGDSNIIWFGRIDYTKGLDIAINLANQIKKPLKAAYFLDPGRADYFNREIKPLLNKNITLINEIKDIKTKSDFLAQAKVLLFPIRWDEPFGIVMVEAMATGTPVVAFARGSVPEVIKDGVTGFIVNTADDDIRGDFIIKKTGMEGLMEAVERIYSLTPEKYQQMRKTCREYVEQNFTIDKMVDKYEEAYKKVIGR